MNVLFTPMPLLYHQKLAWLRDYGIFQEDESPDLVFRWEYAMTKFREVKNIWGVPVINDNCLDVSKVTVNRIFEQVYGYSTEVNQGWAIEKPNLTNGMKDVRLVNLDKQDKRKDYFYQRFLTKGLVIEVRLVIMDSIPVYRIDKIKEVTDDNICGKIMRYEINPVQKNGNIIKFCQLLGLDYGELDIINDVIIDVNPTPGDAAFVRMPINLSTEYFKNYCELFKKHYYAKEG